MSWYFQAFLSILIIAFFEGFTAGELSAKDATSRIINGTVITIENAPYMVQLRNQSNNFTNCGGTLISLQHVLTAAHCFEFNYTMADYFVVAGASLRNETGVRREITHLYKHPNRIEGEFAYDVAIIKLDTPYEEGKKIKAKTKFCSNLPGAGTFIGVYGWGVKIPVKKNTTINGTDYSNELRVVRVPIITNDNCIARAHPLFEEIKEEAEELRLAEALNNTLEAAETDGEVSVPQALNNTSEEAVEDYEGLFADALNTTVVCAFKKYYDACKCDSGGAGIYGDELCMVVAGGFGCAFDEYPAYYTSIPSVLDFIEEKLKL